MPATTTSLLSHLEDHEVRHELRGFPESTTNTVLALREDNSPEALNRAILQLVAFYLPKGSAVTDLTVHAPSARLREDLGVDSLAFSEAAFKLEELFDVRIENAELAEISTIDELTQFAQRKLIDD